MRRAFILIALPALAVLAGCATDFAIPYTAAAPPPPVAGAAARSVAVVASDGRPLDRDRIGELDGGHGEEVAPLHATNDIAATIAAAFEQELTGQGYLDGPGGARVSVEIVRFDSRFLPLPETPVPGTLGVTEAHVAVLVKVRNQTGALVFARYYAATPGGPLFSRPASGAVAQQALAAALRNAVALVIGDPQFQTALLQG